MKSKLNQIIENYIKAYNSFDTNAMLVDFDDAIVFENISNNRTNLTLNGITDFRKQAEGMAFYFKERAQKITSLKIENLKVIVEIDYSATLAEDLQDFKKGQELNFKGKSIFQFNSEYKIIKIQDIS